MGNVAFPFGESFRSYCCTHLPVFPQSNVQRSITARYHSQVRSCSSMVCTVFASANSTTIFFSYAVRFSSTSLVSNLMALLISLTISTLVFSIPQPVLRWLCEVPAAACTRFYWSSTQRGSGISDPWSGEWDYSTSWEFWWYQNCHPWLPRSEVLLAAYRLVHCTGLGSGWKITQGLP